MTRTMTALLALAIAAAPGSTADRLSPAGPVAAVAGMRVPGDTDGILMGPDLPEDGFVLVWSGGRRTVSVMAGDQFALDAEIAPDGQRVAVTTGMGRQRLASGVLVCDRDGRTLGMFPGAVAHRWSPDGASLALLFAYDVPRWTPSTQRLGIWRASDARLRRYRVQPEEVYWSVTGSLFLGYADRVDRFVPAWGLALPTPHRGADVSPDGRYAIRHPSNARQWFSITQTSSGAELCGCLSQNAKVDVEPLPDTPPPYLAWVRAPGADHLLWVSSIGRRSSESDRPEPRSSVVDVKTWDRVQSFPGWIVAQSTDPLAVVVLRGDTLALVRLSTVPVHAPSTSTAHARIRISVKPWTGWGRGTQPESSWVHEVAEGDWIPGHLPWVSTNCAHFFRVVSILGPDRVLVRLDGRRLGTADTVIVTRTPVTYRTTTFDAGADVTLSLAR